MKQWPLVVAAAATALSTAGCPADLDTTRTVDSYTSFGDVIYREACQRVAYTGQLAQQQAGAIDRVDVSGALGRAVCVAGDAPPTGAPPALFAIAAQHPEITRTVDAILPQPFLATFETFLERILPLYDDTTVQTAIAKLSELLGQLHDDAEVPPALARIGARHGYRPTALSPGLLHAIVEYPGLADFTGSVLGLIAPKGTANPEWKSLLRAGAVALNTAEAEPDPGSPERTLTLALTLLTSRHPDLATATPRPAVLRDVRGVARVAVDGSGALVAPFVDTDGDGLADLDAAGRFVDASGAVLDVPTPFAEAGVADRAPRDALGRALTSTEGSTTLYQYTDLDGTLLLGAAREAPTILDANRDTALGLVWGASALLGPRAMQTRIYSSASGMPIGAVTFNGFDLGNSAALDLLHGLIQLLGAPAIDEVLEAANTLLVQHESETSRVIGAMLDTADRAKQHPEAQVPATSTIYDELAPLLTRVLAVPGLSQDLLAALGDPHVRGVAPMIARLMTSNNVLDFNHTTVAIGSARGKPNFDVVGNLDTPSPVDRTKPDADYNRSLMQRIAHLIHDSNGLQFCNKEGATANTASVPGPFHKCALFEIDDLAMFFALNMASDSVRMDATRHATTYDVASFREHITDADIKKLVADSEQGDLSLQALIAINGFTRFPTPKALSRALFLRSTDPGSSPFLNESTDPVTCSEGDRFFDVHDKSIFAWELTLPGNPSGFADDTFFDAVRPLIDAFAKHDECVQHAADGTCSKMQNAVKIFVDLLAMLHEHWGSAQSRYFNHGYQATDRSKPRFAYPDNVVSYEPLLAELLRADLVPALLAIGPVLTSMTLDGTPSTPPALPVLSDAMRFVFDPAMAPAGLQYRNGATTATESDGVTRVPVTPFYLLADGFDAKRAVIDGLAAAAGSAPQASAWRSAAHALVDQVLDVDQTGATSWQFHNRRFHAITQILISFVRGRIAAHAATSDLTAWVQRDLTSDLTDKLTGPVFAALGDLVSQVEADPAARAQLYGLLAYLVDEAGHTDVFDVAVTTIFDQLQQLRDDGNLVPIAHALGKLVDPSTGIVDAEIALVKGAHDLDTDQALLGVLRNLFRPGDTGVHPAADLSDVVCAIDRSTPDATGDLSGDDEASVLAALRDFFGDNQRGFLRFANIVHNRNGVTQ